MSTTGEKKIIRLEEARRLFEEYAQDNTNVSSKDRANQICNDLCMSPVYPADDKFTVFRTVLKYDPDLAAEILARWRDSMVFLRGSELEAYISLMVKTTRCPDVSSHERIYTAVHLYNNGFIHVCYTCFADLAFDDTILIKHRLEATRFLFASGDEEEREQAQECLLAIIQDHTYPDKFRYEAIASYISRTGISCIMNTQKLKIPYDEDFVFSLQIPFFNDTENDIRYRILSGQHLVQMSPDVLSEEDKQDVIETLLGIARDANHIEDVRADAADVVMRLGNPNHRAEARQIITGMGYSADGEKKRMPLTVYDDSQNVHNVEIDKHVQTFLEKMLSPSADGADIKQRSYHDVNQEISGCLLSMKLEPAKRHAAYRALSRVSVDTATFTEHKATIAEILIHVWSRIHSGEFTPSVVESLEQRMVDELSDMSDTCSSGHAGRFVNVLSTVDDTLRISWDDQIKANVKGRMQARIRDCEDSDLAASIALGMMEDADPEDKDVYSKWVSSQLDNLEVELRKEFVGDGYIRDSDFDIYFEDVRKDWDC